MKARKSERKEAGVGRRDFLRTATVGGAASVAALAVGGAEAAEAPAPTAGERGRYRESAHVRRVYDLSRF